VIVFGVPQAAEGQHIGHYIKAAAILALTA